MGMLLTTISTELVLNKRLARKLAANALMRNKRACEVLVSGHHFNVVYAYKGSRKDLEVIIEGLHFLRKINK